MGQVKLLGLDVSVAELVTDAACAGCGRSLGRYAFYIRPWGVVPLEAARDAEPGFSRIPDAPTIERGDVGRGPRSGRGRLTLDMNDDQGYVRWSCGCGARGKRRLDRLGEVRLGKDDGRLYL